MNIDQVIEEYESYHQDPTNIKYHLVCVPLIMLSVLGVLNAIPVSLGPLGLGHLVAAIFLGYYLIFARAYFVSCVVLFGLLIIVDMVLSQLPLYTYVGLNIAIFFLAWVGQFLGHRHEGNKPAFVDNASGTIHYTFMAPILVVRHIKKLFS